MTAQAQEAFGSCWTVMMMLFSTIRISLLRFITSSFFGSSHSSQAWRERMTLYLQLG